MKLGILADIHEQLEPLQIAVDCFRENSVDQVVVLGDLFLDGQNLTETCEILSDIGAVGVWGNHDFGLSHNPTQEIREMYSQDVLDFMGRLRPYLEIDRCFFAHVEPWLNPEDIFDLWYFEGAPDTPEKRARIFRAVSHRVIFAGHYHRWLLITCSGIQPWDGRVPIRLSGDRYFVVIGAVCDGCFAIYDTRSTELKPFRIK